MRKSRPSGRGRVGSARTQDRKAASVQTQDRKSGLGSARNQSRAVGTPTAPAVSQEFLQARLLLTTGSHSLATPSLPGLVSRPRRAPGGLHQSVALQAPGRSLLRKALTSERRPVREGHGHAPLPSPGLATLHVTCLGQGRTNTVRPKRHPTRASPNRG